MFRISRVLDIFTGFYWSDILNVSLQEQGWEKKKKKKNVPAVSMKLRPASRIAWLSWAWASASVFWLPQVMVPRQHSETIRSESPRRTRFAAPLAVAWGETAEAEARGAIAERFTDRWHDDPCLRRLFTKGVPWRDILKFAIEVVIGIENLKEFKGCKFLCCYRCQISSNG